MQHLQLINQLLRLTPEPFGYLDLGPLLLGGFRKLFRYLIFAKSVVLELLRSLLAIYHRSEDIVKPELARKDIHHHMSGALVRFTCLFPFS